MQRRTEHGFCIIPLSVHRPFFDFSILVTGILERVQVYETFIKGAKDGFYTVLKIMPTLIGLMVAVGVAAGFRLSGVLVRASRTVDAENRISRRIGAAFCRKDVFFVRSDRASDRSLQRVWHRFLYRAHSASISMACTETIFYTMSVYL